MKILHSRNAIIIMHILLVTILSSLALSSAQIREASPETSYFDDLYLSTNNEPTILALEPLLYKTHIRQKLLMDIEDQRKRTREKQIQIGKAKMEYFAYEELFRNGFLKPHEILDPPTAVTKAMSRRQFRHNISTWRRHLYDMMEKYVETIHDQRNGAYSIMKDGNRKVVCAKVYMREFR